jgi:hypothetical protein
VLLNALTETERMERALSMALLGMGDGTAPAAGGQNQPS